MGGGGWGKRKKWRMVDFFRRNATRIIWEGDRILETIEGSISISGGPAIKWGEGGPIALKRRRWSQKTLFQKGERKLADSPTPNRRSTNPASPQKKRGRASPPRKEYHKKKKRREEIPPKLEAKKSPPCHRRKGEKKKTAQVSPSPNPLLRHQSLDKKKNRSEGSHVRLNKELISPRENEKKFASSREGKKKRLKNAKWFLVAFAHHGKRGRFHVAMAVPVEREGIKFKKDPLVAVQKKGGRGVSSQTAPGKKNCMERQPGGCYSQEGEIRVYSGKGCLGKGSHWKGGKTSFLKHKQKGRSKYLEHLELHRQKELAFSSEKENGESGSFTPRGRMM